MVPKGALLARDMTGKKFGLLTVLYRSPQMWKSSGHVLWVCQCECGNVTRPIAGKALRNPEGTRSCGCLSAAANRESRKQIVDRQCVLCGAKFRGRIWSRYCSKRCRYRTAHVRCGRVNPVRQVQCIECGEEFLTTLTKKCWCSKRCGERQRKRQEYRRKRAAEFHLAAASFKESIDA